MGESYGEQREKLLFFIMRAETNVMFEFCCLDEVYHVDISSLLSLGAHSVQSSYGANKH